MSIFVSELSMLALPTRSRTLGTGRPIALSDWGCCAQPEKNVKNFLKRISWRTEPGPFWYYLLMFAIFIRAGDDMRGSELLTGIRYRSYEYIYEWISSQFLDGIIITMWRPRTFVYLIWCDLETVITIITTYFHVFARLNLGHMHL